MLKDNKVRAVPFLAFPLGHLIDPCRKQDGELDELVLAHSHRATVLACQALLWCVPI